jgi:hypothetical protein
MCSFASLLGKNHNFISDEKNVSTEPPQENQQARLQIKNEH